MLNQDGLDTFIITPGILHSVRELTEITFRSVGLDYKDYVVSGGKLFKPQNETFLAGHSSEAKRILGWEPEVTFPRVVETMVKAELERHTR